MLVNSDGEDQQTAQSLCHLVNLITGILEFPEFLVIMASEQPRVMTQSLEKGVMFFWKPFILSTTIVFQLLRVLWECPDVTLTWFEEEVLQFIIHGPSQC